MLKPGGIAVLTVPNRVSAYHVARSTYEGLRRSARRLRSPGAERPSEHRCVPWRLDRELELAGLRTVDSAACNFIFFPAKELAPTVSDALNRRLDFVRRWRIAPLLGAQYVVKARRG